MAGSEVNSICKAVLEGEQTFHSVDCVNEETAESVVFLMLQNLAKQTIEEENTLIEDTERTCGSLIDQEIAQTAATTLAEFTF